MALSWPYKTQQLLGHKPYISWDMTHLPLKLLGPVVKSVLPRREVWKKGTCSRKPGGGKVLTL